MKHAMGERSNICFNRKIKPEFHGARLTSDGGLLASRDLDDVLRLFNSASDVMNDRHIGRNIQHSMNNLLLQSVYSRLGGYEDLNDAQRLSVDPVMRAVTGKKNATSVNTNERFETEILPLKKNLRMISCRMRLDIFLLVLLIFLQEKRLCGFMILSKERLPGIKSAVWWRR